MPVEVRHRASCKERRATRCPCKPSWRAWLRTGGRDSAKLSATFASKSEALAWERRQQSAKDEGEFVDDPSEITVERAGAEMIAGMKAGSVLNRSGEPYRLNVAQAYESTLRLHVNPVIGEMRVVDVARADVQKLVGVLMAKRQKPSTVRDCLKPVQVLFKHAAHDGLIAVNPCTGIKVPRGTGKRDRIASPEEAVKLIDALRPTDRALWATAFYAGLRQGEIAALRWGDIDFEKGIISVTRGWDWRNRAFTHPKTQAGRRRVPLLAVLRERLEAHALEEGVATGVAGLVFGATYTRPFRDTAVRKRAQTAWRNAKLRPISLHECRHTFASLLIAAGVNVKSIQVYLGHANVQTTLDVYGHLLPGSHAVDAELLDQFLSK